MLTGSRATLTLTLRGVRVRHGDRQDTTHTNTLFCHTRIQSATQETILHTDCITNHMGIDRTKTTKHCNILNHIGIGASSITQTTLSTTQNAYDYAQREKKLKR